MVKLPVAWSVVAEPAAEPVPSVAGAPPQAVSPRASAQVAASATGALSIALKFFMRSSFPVPICSGRKYMQLICINLRCYAR